MTNQERDEYLKLAYRNMFGTPQGVSVLTDILYHLCYFLPATGEGAQACNNQAKLILTKCGSAIAGAVYAEYEKLSTKETQDGE